jgi:hypothetical protein
MKKCLLMIFMSMISCCVMAEDCEKNIIEAVFLEDSSFTLKSGAKYQVDWSEYKVEYADENDIKLWMASDKVLICGNLLINTDSYSQKVPVIRK